MENLALNLQKIEDHQNVKVLIRPSDVILTMKAVKIFQIVISREYRGEYDEYEILSEKGEIHSFKNE